jgi:hypothetical protein
MARDQMGVYMRDTLSGVKPILNGNVQAGSPEDALDHPADPTYCQKQVHGLGRSEVRNARHTPAWRYQNVAREDGLEVDEREGQGSNIEDLSRMGFLVG